MIEIFDIQDGKVVLTPNCLLIPHFKAVIDKFGKDDALVIFAYINFMHNPRSAYANTPEEEKSEIIIQDLKLEVSLDEPEIEAALEKAEELFATPTRRFYLDAKIGREKMGRYLRDAQIIAGRDGNYSTYLSSLKSVGTITAEFEKLEKSYMQEVIALRGNTETSYDEGN